MEILELLAGATRLLVGMYLTFTAIFNFEVKDRGVRFGVGLLLMGSVGGF